MNDDDVTKMQMTEFCEQARAAVAADRVVLVASTDGQTNMCAAVNDGNDEMEVLADIVCDLIRAVISVYPGLQLTIQSEGLEPMTFDHSSTGMNIRQRIVEEVSRGDVG